MLVPVFKRKKNNIHEINSSLDENKDVDENKDIDRDKDVDKNKDVDPQGPSQENKEPTEKSCRIKGRLQWGSNCKG